ncbi:hypothetical protein [Trinickia dinghuensis]|uniref:hypothetical protein n=1 Tax=Trinickia dinghuensis TaxID=2291023 RepID=UPI0015F1A875|nr:hypothetical protein [Trinickia dinghuensis]
MQPDTLSPAIREDWLHCLPGFKLTHTIHLVSSPSLSVVSLAAELLEAENAAVERWVVTRCGDLLEQRIVLEDMTEKRAVRLREQLAVLEGVLRARVEHHFVRARAAAARSTLAQERTQTIPVA